MLRVRSGRFSLNEAACVLTVELSASDEWRRGRGDVAAERQPECRPTAPRSDDWEVEKVERVGRYRFQASAGNSANSAETVASGGAASMDGVWCCGEKYVCFKYV